MAGKEDSRQGNVRASEPRPSTGCVRGMGGLMAVHGAPTRGRGQPAALCPTNSLVRPVIMHRRSAPLRPAPASQTQVCTPYLSASPLP